MNPRPAVAEALATLVAFLDARGVPYALMGGLAVAAHAIPRPTFDVDVLVGVRDDGVAAFAAAAEDAGFSVGDEFRRGFVDNLAGLGKIRMTYFTDGRLVPVDVFVLSSEFQRSAFARRTRHETPLGPLWVLSVEDLLLHKVLADRKKDRADVADILGLTGLLDVPYLREWGGRLAVMDRLSLAFSDAGRASELG